MNLVHIVALCFVPSLLCGAMSLASEASVNNKIRNEFVAVTWEGPGGGFAAGVVPVGRVFVTVKPSAGGGN